MIKLNFKHNNPTIYLICVGWLAFFSSAECAFNVEEAEKAFELAWNNPSYTQIKLDDIDINATLFKYYETPVPIDFTREMLWDMESKKAWDPKTYIPYVVKEGQSWGREILANGDEIFVRSSQQKQWLNRDIYGEVFEEVYLNHREQRATFLGTQCLKDSSNETLYLKNDQPLFHIQHGVEGEENNPVNVWRIVHLTDAKDQSLIEHFKTLNNPKAVPGFVEIYIEKDLQIPLSHK